MDTVRWLLVGAGDIARKRVGQALARAEGSTLAAICDVQEPAARETARAWGAGAAYTDLDKALAQADVDAVYVATPVWLHAAQAVAALEQGRHVLVEKPLGRDAQEARSVVAAAAAAGRAAGCAYFRRFLPRYAMARDMLAGGAFGRVMQVRMTYVSWFDPAPDDPKRWRVEAPKSGGGVLSDMGSHMFDLLVGLFGLPETVFARCDTLAHDWRVEDTASMIMTLPGGAHVTASFGWHSRTWRHELEIVGTEAKLLWLPCDTGPVTRTVGRDVASIDLPAVENVHLPLVQEFVDALRASRAPACSAGEALKANLVLDAVYRSAAEGRPADVPAP